MCFESMTPEQLIGELTRVNAASKKAYAAVQKLHREEQEILAALRPSLQDRGTTQILLEPHAKVPTLLEIGLAGDNVWCEFKPLRGPDAIEWRPDLPEVEVLDDPAEEILAERDVAMRDASLSFEPHPHVDFKDEVA